MRENVGYLPGEGIPPKSLDTTEARVFVDQIVSLVEGRCHPDEFGKAATGEVMLQATVRLIGWETTHSLLSRPHLLHVQAEKAQMRVIEDFMNQPAYKSVLQNNEEWLQRALAAKENGEVYKPERLPSMTRRQMSEYAENIRDAVLLQHPAGTSEDGRLEAFIMAGRMLWGYKFFG